ncbi:hypothetical protein IB265_33380 [Ensifer sp. ENS10]|uniref:hypothetical protein n=1 Tax=Ensifer sp. ENS10 TaxID=2769286 RepID=UPI00177F3F65|nr:hypothetical protein [Ensifer sp. ENS10]MBD9511650.1 hypothetical protein [Ensifer sp. ENS10]
MAQVNRVYSVTAGRVAGSYLVKANITDFEGETYDCDYMSYANDTNGLNPAIRQWLADNPDFPSQPYVPPSAPTEEELRAQMPTLSSRQFWLAALEIGITKTIVQNKIKTLGLAPLEEARWSTELDEAKTFERTSQFLAELTGLFNIPPNELDVLWTWASKL